MHPRYLLLLLLPLGACKRTEGDPSLHTFADCDELEDYLKDAALEEARWSWSFDTSFYVLMGDKAEDDWVDAGEDGSGGMDVAGEFSTTNLQELGVDEDDLMKTDGSLIYALAGGELLISQAWPVEDAVQLGHTAIDGRPEGIYLLSDRDLVVVVSRVWLEGDMDTDPRSGDGIQDELQATEDTSGDREYWGWAELTQVSLVDVADPAAPEVIRETYTTGAFVTSRRIGDTLYLVTTESSGLEIWGDTYREVKQDIQATELDNVLALRQDHLAEGEDWNVTVETACDCTDVYASDYVTGTAISTVSTLDLADPDSAFVGTAVVGRADVVYMSPNAIYVAWSEQAGGVWSDLDGNLETFIHRLDVSEGQARPEYTSTGRVAGVLPDQFGLSEYDGVLRAATTVVGSWDDSGSWSSSVWTLKDDGQGRMEVLDRAEGLAPGEEIYAARFVGQLGYIVTYEVMLGDPLFTIDLSDPYDIEVTGELPVTGWSDYIQPMDAGHLLTVGMDDVDGDSGWEADWQVAVSIFDVTDLYDPQLQDRVIIEAWGSESQFEHHAFNYFPSQQALAIPSWGEDWVSQLEVFHADPDEPLAHLGTVTQDGIMAESSTDTYCMDVRRSVFMEDKLWAVGEAGLTSVAVADPSTELSHVTYEGIDPCDDGYGW